MKRELGIARCGLACCLCSENDHCLGCSSAQCTDKDWCENRKCSIEKTVLIATIAGRTAENVCFQRSSRTVLLCLLRNTVKKIF